MPYMLGSPSNIGPGNGLVERFDGPVPKLPGLGCGGSCGCSKDCGGLGFFDSGMDISGWGIAEWSTVAGLGYMVLSTVFTTKRAVRSVGRKVRRARRRVKVATA